MILVDSSAWIEFLRASDHAAHRTLKHHLTRRSAIGTTEPIVMELLAGTRTPAEYAKLRARLLPFPLLRLRSLSDFEKAADLYRTCRREGETVRRLIDCLIAAVAIRERATVLRDMAGFAPRGSAMRLLCAAGARPNFVKIAPILEAAAVPGVEALLKRVDNHADHALVT